MFTGTRDRKQRDRDQRRAAANRRIGHELAWAYYWESELKFAVLVVALGAAGWFLWTRVDHHLIAGVAGGLGVLLFAAWLVWFARSRSLYVRSMRVANGGTATTAWWLTGAAGLVLIAAAVVLWRNL